MAFLFIYCSDWLYSFQYTEAVRNSKAFSRKYFIFSTNLWNFVSQNGTVKIFRTLSILLVSGVNILTALELTEKAVGSQRFAQAVKYCRQGVSRGEELAEAMAKTNVFPKVALKMVAVGEQTGSIDIMVSRAAQYYESETSHLVDRLSSLLEPLLIIIMAAVIGFICLSVLLPMLDIYQIL